MIFLELIIWLNEVTINVKELSSLLELVSLSVLLSKFEEKYSSCCPLFIVILIPSVSMEISTTLPFDIYPSRLFSSLICRFLLRRYIGWSLLLTRIIFSGGVISKTKKFFFFVADLIIFPACYNIFYSR